MCGFKSIAQEVYKQGNEINRYDKYMEKSYISYLKAGRQKKCPLVLGPQTIEN